MSMDDERDDIVRCEVTGHPVGTDTWIFGTVCPCATCQDAFGHGTITNLILARPWTPRPVEHFYL